MWVLFTTITLNVVIAMFILRPVCLLSSDSSYSSSGVSVHLDQIGHQNMPAKYVTTSNVRYDDDTCVITLRVLHSERGSIISTIVAARDKKQTFGAARIMAIYIVSRLTMCVRSHYGCYPLPAVGAH